MKARSPRTLLEAVTCFSDPDRAHAHFVSVRCPNGVACPRHGCGSASVQVLAKRRKFRCKECGRDFTAKVGTIFEASPISLSKWLPAVWLLANTKNGTSSHEIGPRARRDAENRVVHAAPHPGDDERREPADARW